NWQSTGLQNRGLQVRVLSPLPFFLCFDDGLSKALHQALAFRLVPVCRPRRDGDRKSTRLNSSHVKISYAVFCLKKKNNYYNKKQFFFKFYYLSIKKIFKLINLIIKKGEHVDAIQ